MVERKVLYSSRAQKINMGGILIEQPLPSPSVDNADPFLLIHHWKTEFPGGQKQSDLGVSPHPHTGFSPVTLIFDGGLHHRDSKGNDSVVRSGGTQWMNAGSGIIHSERPSYDIASNGGPFELIQLWVNTPSKEKGSDPYYQPISKEETPSLMSEDGKFSLGLVAGKYKGELGPAKTMSPLLVLRGEGKKDGVISIPLEESFNVVVYVLDGIFSTGDGTRLREKDMALFARDGEGISIQCESPGKFILLGGKPLEEPVVAHGPFVMNTVEEINGAISDFRSGKFGDLKENFDQ